MGFFLLIIGLLMVVTGLRGTYAQFGSQLASEFRGQNNFTYQLVALGAIGAVGYIPALQTMSRWLLAALLFILLIEKGNQSFFTQFTAALNTGPQTPSATGAASGPSVASQIPSGQAAALAAGQTVSGVVTLPGSAPTSTQGATIANTSGGFWNWLGISSPFGN